MHAMVRRRPLIFAGVTAMRYAMVSRIHFLECAANSALMYGAMRGSRRRTERAVDPRPGRGRGRHELSPPEHGHLRAV
jgi:hypothetical protein